MKVSIYSYILQDWIPACAGMTVADVKFDEQGPWIPAFARMTPRVVRQDEPKVT